MPKGIVKFTVSEHEYWVAYAKGKGFESVGALARFTLTQYEARYPLKGLLHVRAEANGAKEKGDQ